MKNYQKPDVTFISLEAEENITVDLSLEDNPFAYELDE